MNPFLGTFVVGDNVNAARISIKDDAGVAWGTAVATGYSVSLEVRRPGVQTLFATVAGTWEDSTEGAALFVLGIEPLLEPAAGLESADFEALVVLTNGGARASLGAGDNALGIVPYAFKVRAWP